MNWHKQKIKKGQPHVAKDPCIFHFPLLLTVTLHFVNGLLACSCYSRYIILFS